MINADWVQLNCRVKPIEVSWCKLEYQQRREYVAGRGVVTIFETRKTFAGGIPREKVFTELQQSNKILFHSDYTVKLQDFRTSLAASVYYVYYKSTKIAEVLTDVDSKVIDEKTVFVRFDNKFLYGENLYNRVVKFLDENGLMFHNWTRFDIAYDFNFFKNGLNPYSKNKDLNPAKLIESYTAGKVRLLNKRRGKKRKGNVYAKDVEHIPVDEKQFKQVAEKNKTVLRDLINASELIPEKEKRILLNEVADKQTFGVWFDDGEGGIDLQTLRLGSKYSAVTCKLYNKTKELTEQEDKPYIREQWSLNGLERYEIETRERVPVWRLEFSITDFNSVVCPDDESEDYSTLKTLEILKDENAALLWNVLQEHYFQFVKPSKTDKNITRSGQRVELFDKVETGLKLKDVSEKENTTRAHKIFIKKLLETQQTIRENNSALNKVNWATDYVAAWLVNKHDLREWAASRFPGWRYENYMEVPNVRIDVTQLSLTGDGFIIGGAKYLNTKAEPYKHTY